MLHTIKRP